MASSKAGSALLCTVAWAVAHALATPILQISLTQVGVPGLSQLVGSRIANLAAERQRVLRRMVRAQVYYLAAGPLGVALLVRCRSFPDLLHLHTPLHDLGFTLALSHWIVSLIEDASSPRSSFVVRLGRAASDPQLSLYDLYLIHHAIAIIAFSVCLFSRSLPALGACGLCFGASPASRPRRH